MFLKEIVFLTTILHSKPRFPQIHSTFASFKTLDIKSQQDTCLDHINLRETSNTKRS